MDGKDGLVTEELVFAAGDFQMVLDVSGHVLVFETFEVASADDAGRQGS